MLQCYSEMRNDSTTCTLQLETRNPKLKTLPFAPSVFFTNLSQNLHVKKTGLFFVFAIFFFKLYSQPDSSHLRISLITCSPGAELYSTFGHSAIRVVDSAVFTDKVYNYGTFEFDDDFYMNFVKGRLLYYLSVENYRDFVAFYREEGRSISEQVLDLTGAEKLKLQKALITNAAIQNRYYKYQFLFDNCATRIRDIVKSNTDEQVTFKKIIPADDITFRKMIHSYLHKTGNDWSGVGIDILLGMSLDKKVKNEEAMFLPDYLAKGFDSAYNGSRRLLLSTHTIYTAPQSLNEKRSAFTPFVVFTIIVIIYLLIAYWSRRVGTILDFMLFFVTGLLGVLLVFMWIGTDHADCKNNLNLLWALPSHLFAAFFIISKRSWIKKYWSFTAFLLAAVLLFWFFLPQQFNNALIPLVILLAWRSWVLSRRN